jgi:ribose 1,5-bisphosphokinase
MTIGAEPAAPIGPGKLVLVVGPSGAGKDTLIGLARKFCAGNDRVVFPRRTVTRPSSAFEDNLMLTPSEFDAALAKKDFALHWQAHGHRYGIPRSIDNDIGTGKTVIVNVSRTIIALAQARYGNVVVVLVTAPADVLAQRLAARKRASDADVGERLQRAELDADFAADVVINNVGDPDANARRVLDALI